MRILVSIDDTDDEYSRGTGEIAEILAAGIERNGWGACGRVTRHQLFLHPDIAYTSHNSSMCFPVHSDLEQLDAFIDWCGTRLGEESVSTADPGLCVLAVDNLADPGTLIEYGRSAKLRIYSKDEAYSLARELGVHLSEHGGTGIGVIGALAGAGLRLSGNDGRFKGKFRIPSDSSTATVATIKTYGAESVRTQEGRELGDEDVVEIHEECKFVLLDGTAVLLVEPGSADGPAPWRIVSRKALKSY